MERSPLGQRVRALRLQRKLSLDALAASVGLTREELRAGERGQAAFTLPQLDRLATALGTDLWRLIDLPLPPGVLDMRPILDGCSPAGLKATVDMLRPLLRVIEEVLALGRGGDEPHFPDC